MSRRLSIAAVLATAQLASVAVFFYAAHRADSAMDKSGFGDLDAFRRWTEIGGEFFRVAVILWGATTASLCWAALGSFRLALAYGLCVPLAFVVAYAAYLVL